MVVLYQTYVVLTVNWPETTTGEKRVDSWIMSGYEEMYFTENGFWAFVFVDSFRE